MHGTNSQNPHPGNHHILGPQFSSQIIHHHNFNLDCHIHYGTCYPWLTFGLVPWNTGFYCPSTVTGHNYRHLQTQHDWGTCITEDCCFLQIQRRFGGHHSSFSTIREGTSWSIQGSQEDTQPYYAHNIGRGSRHELGKGQTEAWKPSWTWQWFLQIQTCHLGKVIIHPGYAETGFQPSLQNCQVLE